MLDRRGQARLPVRWAGAVTCGATHRSVTIEDLSATGVRVRGTSALVVGERGELDVHYLRSSFRGPVEVAWVSTAEGRAGLCFGRLAERERAWLDDALRAARRRLLPKAGTVLVVGVSERARAAIATTLVEHGWRLHAVATPLEAISALGHEEVAAVVVASHLTSCSGSVFLDHLQGDSPRVRRVLVADEAGALSSIGGHPDCIVRDPWDEEEVDVCVDSLDGAAVEKLGKEDRE